MNTLKPYFNINFYFFVITLFVAIFFVFNLDKGLEFTDESYILLYSLYANDVVGKITNFGLFGNILLNITNFDLYYFRIIGFLLLLISSLAAFKGLIFFYKTKNFDVFADNYLIFYVAITGSLCFYRHWVITPSYNMYNLCGALFFISGLFFILPKSNFLGNFNSFFLISLGLFICFVSKPTTAIFLSIVLTIWLTIFYRKFFIRIFFSLFIVGIIIFFMYVFLNFHSLKLYLDDLFFGYELKKTLDPRYDFFNNLIFTIKYLVKDVMIHWLFFIIQIFGIIFLKKINRINFSIIFSIISLIIFDNLNILFISLLINLLFLCDKKLILKKENILLILIPMVIFIVSFGTNTNPVNHVHTSAIFYFLLMFHIINLYPIDIKSKGIVFVILLCVHLSVNIHNNIFKPQRYRYNLLNQNNKITIPNFNNHIYVDNFVKSYFDQISDLKSKLNDKNIKYLIDYTGHQPILNLLFGYKFIVQPWWSGVYIESNDYINLIINKPNKKYNTNTLVVTNDDISLEVKPYDMDNNDLKKIGIDLQKNYEVLGVIDLSSYTTTYTHTYTHTNQFDPHMYNFKVWRPKK